jgi:hypothetical protein
MDADAKTDFESLFDYYLSHGCPCRFPRFRATVGRDMKEIGAPQWDVSEVPALLQIFDRRVPLTKDTETDYSIKGRCKICNAQVYRWGAPVFRDSFIERARITPGDLPDVGADADGPVPVCGSVYPAGPSNVMRVERERIENAFPRLSPSLWLEYMKALANG